MSYIIGVDVGGTNTDAAVIKGNTVIGWNKSSTTENIIEGVIKSITESFRHTEENGYKNVCNEIKRISIGTTHFINAVIKRTGLSKVACIRLCGVSSQSLPPFSDFPKDLKDEINGGCYMVNGGFEFDGRVITEIDESEIIAIIKKVQQDGVKHVAICGIFSPVDDSQEKFVEKLIKKHAPELTCTTSCTLGYLGLLERENATILNESLKTLCVKTISGFRISLSDMGLTCPVFFTQNDGTLISEKQTLDFPVYTFSSGATNSMRGAVHLSALKDAIVVDIGGTSTDVGVLVNGFPREASTRVKVAGVNTNFRMPDTKSIGLGGGSFVIENKDKGVTVGPGSVEYRLKNEALVFGGSTLVSTDIVVAAGYLEDLGDKKHVSHLSKEFVDKTMAIIQGLVEGAVDSVKLSKEDYPVVLVGGGSILIDVNKPFVGASKIIKPPFYQVANAVGAALSQVSGTYDKLVEVKEDQSRDSVIEYAKQCAIEEAVQNGAVRETCTILDVTEVHMTYVALPRKRLRVKAVGDLQEKISETSSTTTTTTTTKPALVSKMEKIEKSLNQEVVADQQKKTNGSEGSKQQTLKPSIIPEKVTDYKPTVNDKGEWILSSFDVECLTLGAGVLGCGGGGSPYLGRLELLQCMEEGYQPKIIHPKSFKDGLAYCTAYMGAPEILYERLPNKTELSTVLKMSQKLSEMGFRPGQTTEEIRTLASKNDVNIETQFDGKCLVIDYNGAPSDQSPAAILPAEIGGMNALGPLTVAARLNVPVIDCDGMGRAFPKLQHFGPFMYGFPAYPAVLCDNHGKTVCCVKTETATDLENFFRTECIKSGCGSAVSMSCFGKEEVQTKMCQHTLTQAWYIGLAILNARQLHMDATQAILKECNGVLVAMGKISDVLKETKEGFTKGHIYIEGTGDYKGKNVIVGFQNEYLILRNQASNDVLATTPDLITLVETDTGEPVQSSELKYGVRVSVLVLPAPPLMSSELALEFVGPQAFGYDDVTFSNIGNYKLHESIAKVVE